VLLAADPTIAKAFCRDDEFSPDRIQRPRQEPVREHVGLARSKGSSQSFNLLAASSLSRIV
jgi:hypothetical protein